VRDANGAGAAGGAQHGSETYPAAARPRRYTARPGKAVAFGAAGDTP